MAEAIRGAHLLFITAGMGGGTGTGAAPVIAEIAKEMGILTVAVVTKPFSFEGGRRMRCAEKGIENLKDKVDSMIVILNEKLESECPPNATMKECFEMSNEVLYKACVGIAEIIHTPGTINVDFEDLKTAIACPLLEGANLQGARGLLAYFTGNESVTLAEIKEAMAVLNTFVHKSAIVIFGSAISEEMGDEIRVTLVATGLDRPLDANEPGSGVQAPAVFNASSEAPAGLQTPVFGQTLEAPAPEPAAQQGDAAVDVSKFVIPTYLK